MSTARPPQGANCAPSGGVGVHTSRHIVLLAAGVAIAFGLAACGERPQVVDYKQGTYQGKPDQPPWDSAKFNGNQNDWELAIKQRNQNQNEYKRTN